MKTGFVSLPSGNAVFLRDYGAGKPFLILHGLLGTGDNWHPIAEALRDRYRVLVPDARNHGRSFHDPDAGYAAMAGDAAELLQALEVSSAAVLGHSMGGKTAMHLACRHPDRVRALIVADMAPRAYTPRHGAVLRALNGLHPESLRSRSEADALLAPDVPDSRERAWLLKNLAPADDGGYRLRSNPEALENAADALAAALPASFRYLGPSLFLRGEESDYVTAADRAGIRARFPRAVVVTVKGAGHWVHADAPEAVTASIRTFLKSAWPRKKPSSGAARSGTGSGEAGQ